MFKPSTAAASTSSHHRVLGGTTTATTTTETITEPFDPDCKPISTPGTKWDGFVLNYYFSNPVDPKLNFSAPTDLWVTEPPTGIWDTMGQGTKPDYLSKDCNSQDW